MLDAIKFTAISGNAACCFSGAIVKPCGMTEFEKLPNPMLAVRQVVSCTASTV